MEELRALSFLIGIVAFLFCADQSLRIFFCVREGTWKWLPKRVRRTMIRTAWYGGVAFAIFGSIATRTPIPLLVWIAIIGWGRRITEEFQDEPLL